MATHNEFRELHSIPPLTYSPEHEKTAQSWAETLAITMILTYSPENGTYLENCAEVRNAKLFEGIFN